MNIHEPLTARQLQQVNKSFVVNVPIVWAKRQKLGKGSTILMTTDDKDRLILTAAKQND